MGYHNLGVAQGGMVDTPWGDWYLFMFHDRGALGRLPMIMTVHFDADGYPVIGESGKVPESVSIESTRPDYEYSPLNGDDDLLSMIQTVNGKAVHHFGISETEGFEVFATDIENLGLAGSRAVMHIGGSLLTKSHKPEESYPVEITLPGQHMVINAMAAAMVGRLLGLQVEEIQRGIKSVEPVGGRSHIVRLAKRTVIDDCYNANPVSMKAALDLLSGALGRKIAILGDMFELGNHSDKMHEEVGAYAVEKEIDAVFCVGESARFMYDAALVRYDGMQDIRYFAAKEELLESLPDLVLEGDTILVKASHGMGFAEIVEALKQM